MRKPSWVGWLVIALWALFHSPAQAALLRFTVTTGEGPQAMPLVKVTVSGVQVFNQRTGSFNIPVGTTGQVSIQIVELPEYQQISSWSGVCAGLTQGNCEFSAGQDVTYDAGISVKNLFGSVRFTSSSADFVRPPDTLKLTVLSGTERVGTTLEPNVIQPCCNTQTLLIGAYSLRPESVSGNDNCFQVSTAAGLTATLLEGQETVVDVKYRADRCVVTASLLDPSRGSVVSAPAGIDCPNGVIPPETASACSAFFAFKSKVGLQASPVAGSVFAGWDAGCGSKLDSLCETDAVPGGAKVARFVAATPGNADLSIVPSSFLAVAVGGGRVRVSFTITNNGTDPAVSLRAQIFSTDSGVFTEIPGIVSDSGNCFDAVNCLWGVSDLATGQSKTLSFTAATSQSEFNLRACALGANADPNRSNNCSSGTATLNGSLPSGLAVTLGLKTPGNATGTKGSGLNPLLQFTLNPTNGPVTLEGLTLQASGTGDDAQDLTSVVVIADQNANGLQDAGETFVASGTFNANDGALTLTPSSPTSLNAPTSYLVTVSINSVLAANRLTVALGSALLLLGLLRSRRRWLIGIGLTLGLTLTLSSCPGPTPGAQTRTYMLQLTALTVIKNAQPLTISGLPLSGAVLSVEK